MRRKLVICPSPVGMPLMTIFFTQNENLRVLSQHSPFALFESVFSNESYHTISFRGPKTNADHGYKCHSLY